MNVELSRFGNELQRFYPEGFRRRRRRLLSSILSLIRYIHQIPDVLIIRSGGAARFAYTNLPPLIER